MLADYKKCNMEKEKRTHIIDEIKQIERQLYLKKSQLTIIESNYEKTELDTKDWKQIFSRWIEQVGLRSVGGNSVEDIREERQR